MEVKTDTGPEQAYGGGGTAGRQAHEHGSAVTSGHFFADTPQGYGVTHVFCVPEVFATALEPLHRAGIAKVMARHEVAAAYMASGYGRAGRKPGVYMSQQVGVANEAAEPRDVFLASAPVVCITGGTTPAAHHRHH